MLQSPNGQLVDGISSSNFHSLAHGRRSYPKPYPYQSRYRFLYPDSSPSKADGQTSRYDGQMSGYANRFSVKPRESLAVPENTRAAKQFITILHWRTVLIPVWRPQSSYRYRIQYGNNQPTRKPRATGTGSPTTKSII
jgi:hypothetical protein